MGLIRTVAPTVEPVTIVEVEKHLRLDATSVEPTPAVPTALLAGAGAGNVDNGAHRYRLTFVTADGETDGGDISSAITVVDKTADGKINLTNLAIGGSNVTARRIYRTLAAGAAYYLVATVNDNSTTEYVDNIADASLGAGIPAQNTTSDPELRSLIKSARESVETFTGRALLEQTWKLTLDCFPACGKLLLPRPNLLSVTTVKYYDTGGALQTMSTNDYAVDIATLPGRVLLNYGVSWPITRAQYNAVEITYKAGYGAAAASVPEAIKSAMKLVIADLYRNREPINIGNIINDLPAAKRLLWEHRYLEAA